MNIDSALGNGINGPARWSLRLFGGFELSVLPGGERVALAGKRERVLLAYLALSPNGRQPRRKLTTLLWGDAADETVLDNLRHCLWGLRKALGDIEHRLIAFEGEEIVLDPARDVRKAGLVDYGRARGWPEFCRPQAPTTSCVFESQIEVEIAPPYSHEKQSRNSANHEPQMT